MIHWPGCCITARLPSIKPTLDLVDEQGVKQKKWGFVGLQHILKTLRFDPQLVLVREILAQMRNVSAKGNQERACTVAILEICTVLEI